MKSGGSPENRIRGWQECQLCGRELENRQRQLGIYKRYTWAAGGAPRFEAQNFPIVAFRCNSSIGPIGYNRCEQIIIVWHWYCRRRKRLYIYLCVHKKVHRSPWVALCRLLLRGGFLLNRKKATLSSHGIFTDRGVDSFIVFAGSLRTEHKVGGQQTLY